MTRESRDGPVRLEQRWNWRALKESASKTFGILLAGSFLGVMDAAVTKFVRISVFGNEVGIIYQVVFMSIAGASAYFGLRNDSWSSSRNLSNILMTIPLATVADNVSIDAQTLRPYFILIPKAGFGWRVDVFAHAQVLSQVAVWVNQQSLAHGFINGYAAALAMTVGYLAMQFLWSRRRTARRSEVRTVRFPAGR